MKYEDIDIVNSATMAYAAAVQAYIAAEGFWLEMWQTEPGSLPGRTDHIDFAKNAAITSRVHLELAERRLTLYLKEFGMSSF